MGLPSPAARCPIFQGLGDGPALAVSDAVMLRISKRPSGGEGDGLALALEGRLVGPWVDELQRVVDEASDRQGLTVDLRGLEFADGAGVSLLRALRGAGSRLVGGSGFVGALIGTEQSDDPTSGRTGGK